ncbi:hypothetical protein CIG19_09400 [Enterobacterales bacterium CwR94]|nr:hypothetical protein CIG19_09400 [Enterobacterales bacterium CwR94]
MRLRSLYQNKKSVLVRTCIYTQIAMQAGMALTPFWASTVQAAITEPQDSTFMNATAGTLNSLGQAAQSGSLSGLAAQQATGVATQQLQQWLNGFGTARIELGTDGHFKPRTGAADLLLPLYKSDSRLLFTQNGLRNLDGQFTGNMGIGQRHFIGDWMFGYNAFYDQNFSHGHKRLGTGVEAWRDYLKLTGNGYWRLSGWRDSGDVEDYDARPANGFDLRAEAWLPAYPALGGRLMYEQYYGEEVALFGKDQRQRNPNAVTAGLSWTPVPLISLTADHKKGGSQSETAFGLQVSWQLGQSLAAQFDPANVSLKRTLAGSGMDLVERNNNIVLEYRKQQVIELVLPNAISGEGGTTQPIHYQVNTKYGLANIVWNDAAIVAAGGKITGQGAGGYQLTLPKFVAGTANTYTLSGAAHDVRGNISKVSTTTVTVARPAVSAKNSTTLASHDVIIADGKTTSLISITLRDETGLPVTGLASELAVALAEQANTAETRQAKTAQAPAQPATLSKITEQPGGVYNLTLTSANRPATAVITPSLEQVALAAATVKQISDAATAIVREGDLKLLLDNVVANGKAESRVQARVTDATGNPVAGVAVTFTLSGSAQVAAGSSLSGISDADGVATLQFTDAVAETVSVAVSTSNGGNAKVNATFIADATTAMLADGSLTADRITAIADGNDTITYRTKVVDAKSNPISGINVNWRTDAGNLSADASVTGPDGIARIALTSIQAVPIRVSASVNTSTLDADAVTFTADAGNLDATKSALNATPATIVADGSAASTLSLSLKDKNDNPVPGQSVVFNSSLTDTTASPAQDNGDGTYTANLIGTKAGTTTITISIGGIAFAVAGKTVTLTADAANLDAAKSTLDATPTTIVADGTRTSSLTLTLKDKNDNPVPGQKVVFSSSLTGTTASPAQDNGDGTYTANLTGTKAGAADITVSVGGNPFAVTGKTVTLTADAANLDAAKSTLDAAPTTLVADGTAAATLTLTLKDINENPVPGQAVVFDSSLSGTTASAARENGDGTYTASLTGTKAGVANITVSVGGKPFAVAGKTVTLTADATNLDTAKSTLDAAPTTLVADGTAAATLTLTLKDKNDNPVPGLNVVFNSSLTDTTAGAARDNGDGTYTASLTGTKAGVTNITVSVGGSPFAVAGKSVTLIADITTAKVDTLSADKAKITGSGSETTTLTATVTDIHGNAVAGFTPAWTSDQGTLVGNGVSGADGKATAILTAPTHVATRDGTATVTVDGGKTQSIVIRAVIKAGSAYYWTMYSQHSATSQATADTLCTRYGGGKAASLTDLRNFASGGGDFARMSVTGEFANNWYSLSGTWGTTSGDFHSASSAVGATTSGPGTGYVCVK